MWRTVITQSSNIITLCPILSIGFNQEAWFLNPQQRTSYSHLAATTLHITAYTISNNYACTLLDH